MPVAIVGMHRSGTSLVAQVLAKAGLNLGSTEDLIPAGPDNSDGYWEHAGFHRLNEAVLAELGGGWDSPPVVPARWRDHARLRPLEAEAKRLVAAFGTSREWGWKDPRTSITLALWRELIPDLKVVVCVRNPLEVAFSLNRRGMFSYSTALRLWQTYNERILESTDAELRIVTEYAAYFRRPKPELRRIVTFLGMDALPRSLDEAVAVPRGDLRHMAFDLPDLLDAQVAPDIVELYAWLRQQAGQKSRAGRAQRAPVRAGVEEPMRAVDEQLLEAHAVRKQLSELRPALDTVESRLADRTAELAETERKNASLAQEIELLKDQVRGQEQLIEQLRALHESFFMLEAALSDPPGAESAAIAYARQVQRIKAIVRAETPPGASIAVVSKGDERLVGFYGRRGLHFPQADDGSYAGGQPASALSAIAHLEVVRARGADYFLLPADSLWWLEHYPELRRHLSGRYRRLRWDSEACVLFALREPADAEAGRRQEVIEISGAVRSALGRLPTVLDWGTGLELQSTLPAIEVCRGPANGQLPYADGSFDIVALAEAMPNGLADAVRVATTAVIAFPAPADDSEAVVHLKLPEITIGVTGVSIVVTACSDASQTRRALASLHETLPHEFGGEIVLVDDALQSTATECLEELAASRPRTRIVRNPTPVGPLASANRGAEAAGEETLVFLGADLLLLPGWLRPLVDVLREHEDAGAVGARLLSPDGSLEEAGGVIFGDGSTLRIGHGHVDPDAGLFNYVRRVDHCSRRLFATPRDLFLELGGFDETYRPDLYGDIDYCLALQDRDLGVYYQPEAVGIYSGGTADRREGAAATPEPADPRFLRKWKAVLGQRPARPDVIDMSALHAIAQSQT